MGSANPEERNWISGEDEEAYLYAMQLVSASVMPMVIKSAIELDLLELIKKAGPGAYVSPSQLAAQLPTKNPLAPLMLDRILRLLATHSILTCNLPEDGGIERLYGLAPVCDFLTKNEDGVSMAALLLLNRDRVSMGSWYHLKDAILNGGIPFNKAYGMSVFEYHGTHDPRFKNLFNQAMSHSTITMKKILDVYNGFQGLNTLVDVGGGTGATLDMIVSKYPTIRAINFDLPHVVQDAPTYPSVDHIGGDMFVSVPKGDAIFMKWICHNWSDEQCLKLLNKCYEALPGNGKVIVAESIVPDAPDAMLSTQIALHYDVIMLAQTPGGKERTEKEFKALANGAGFKHFSKICCAYNTWIMEFLK